MHNSIYQACEDVLGLRRWVEKELQYATGTGVFWLPVVLTAKGPLYAEVIGLAEESSGSLTPVKEHNIISYRQPIHLSDFLRQPLYHLGYQLLQYLVAPPATYLLQFGVEDQKIVFDRLWPFPAAPAIASVGVQEPDLFTCHWYCLTGKAIFDLTIVDQN